MRSPLIDNCLYVSYQKHDGFSCFGCSRNNCKFLDINNAVIHKDATEDDEGELDSLRDALYAVKEQLGYFYSKHKKVNLTIVLERQKE